MKVKVIDEQGKEVECKVVSLFKDEGNNINYITYTDGTRGESGKLKLYASRYVIEGDKYILKSIENQYEWDLIDNFLKSKKAKGNG